MLGSYSGRVGGASFEAAKQLPCLSILVRPPACAGRVRMAQTASTLEARTTFRMGSEAAPPRKNPGAASRWEDHLFMDERHYEPATAMGP
jgi:hypothetical protein